MNARPPTIATAGRTRRKTTGTTMDPRMAAPPEGSSRKPDSSGDRPTASCRYCAMNGKVPNMTKMPSMLVATAVLKAGVRNSRRSISGSARRRCRRTNAAPRTNPVRMDRAGSHPGPSWATCLRP
jgi:hypothetical protein